MRYYSGTSRENYDLCSRTLRRNPDAQFTIHCREGTYPLIMSAIGFALKRARQDNSEPVVIEITNPDQFKRVQEHTCYPILIGRLTPENHILHNARDLQATVLADTSKFHG